MNILKRLTSPHRRRMDMRKAALSLVMLAALQAGSAWGQPASKPIAGPGDPRIREYYYDRDAVVNIEGYLGYEMMIEFNPSERIENVSIGDSLAWQVTPNRKATLLFLKPMAASRPTSMTVVTSDRVYSFMLSAKETAAANPMLRLRFLYLPKPEVAAAPPPPPAPVPVLNREYKSSGSERFVPVNVFDNGTSTFFQFDPAKGIPSISFIAPDGGEETANTRVVGVYTIVDLTAETFVIRYGNAKTELRNNAWSKRPKPRPAPYPQANGG